MVKRSVHIGESISPILIAPTKVDKNHNICYKLSSLEMAVFGLKLVQFPHLNKQ